MSRRPELASLALALLLGGCMAEAGTAEAGPTSWFDVGSLEEPPCAPSDAAPLERTVPVALFRHPSVDDAALASVTGAVASWWGARGLRFEAQGAPTPTDIATVFPDDADYSALKGFLDTHARPAAPRLQLVVVPRVVTPSSKLPPAGGFALPAAPGANPDDPLLASLRAHLGEDPWTPTAFLSVEAWRRRGREPEFRWMPAHEVGHLFGLRHTTAAGNLMTREPSPCAPGLTDAQLRRVAGALDALGDPS